MRGRLFTVASVMGLLLCTAAVVLWVRSHLVSEAFTWYAAEPSSLRFGVTSVGWTRGLLFIDRSHFQAQDRRGFDTCMQGWKDWNAINVDSGTVRVHRVLPATATIHLAGLWGSVGFAYDSHSSLGFQPTSVRSGMGFAEVRTAHRRWQVFVPAWAIVFASILLPAFAAARELKRWRKRKEGRCRRCGYNLTCNVSGICPECGTAIPPSFVNKNIGFSHDPCRATKRGSN